MLLHHWIFWSSHYKNENSPRSELPHFTDSRALCLLERFDKWLEFVNWSIVLRFQKNNKVDQRVGKEQTGSQEKNEVICLNKMRTSKNNKQRVQVLSLPLPPASNPDVQMKLKTGSLIQIAYLTAGIQTLGNRKSDHFFLFHFLFHSYNFRYKEKRTLFQLKQYDDKISGLSYSGSCILDSKYEQRQDLRIWSRKGWL